jgi:hypothetical protein
MGERQCDWQPWDWATSSPKKISRTVEQDTFWKKQAL